jgi:hypothetical protein
MTALTDFSTDGAKVRLLISDIDTAAPMFNDASVEAFLSLHGGNVKRAAAAALLVIAVNEVLVQKRIRLLDLTTDGPAEANALRALAAQYRAEADEEAATAAGSVGWLELPAGIGQFDRRTQESWSALIGERTDGSRGG